MPGDDPKANATYMENTRAGVDFLRKASTDEKLSAVDRAGFGVAAAEYEQFAREMSVAHRVVPTEVFEDKFVLADTDAPVEIHFFGRANTAGDAIAWLPKQNVVFTGDVVVAPIPYGFNAYPGEWIGVLNKILALKPAVLVPGHGNPMRDAGYAQRLVEMLETVRSQVARLAEDKSVTNDNVGKQLDLDAARKAWTGDDAWLQRWFRNYWLNPIGSSALREARGEPVVQGAS
jgi:glyoxylase-like metal-dependent hydrolase (beta-lactamase superfamily II)